MILSFKTKIDNRPTFFVEKIHAGLRDILNVHVEAEKHCTADYNFIVEAHARAKIHTIRTDKHERWHPGIMIDFFINARQKGMFRFAPRVPVISIQEIFMTARGKMLEITVAPPDQPMGSDEDVYLNHDQHLKLAVNDGFDSYYDFCSYFFNEIEKHGKETGNYWFKGILIHWTNYRYE